MSMDTHAAGVPVLATAEAPRPARAPAPARDFGVLNVFSQGFLVIWAALVILPLAWAVLNSFKTDKQILSTPFSLPTSLHFENFARAWSSAHIGAYFLHTLIVLIGGVFFTMLLGSMAAYVLARYPFRGNRAVYYFFVAGLTFPVFLGLAPL